MAIRTLRLEGDPVLAKPTKAITEITPRIAELIEDMFDTMYDAGGVGLAGPQVGVLRKIAVIDVGEDPLVFINPEIIEVSGEQVGDEGCLSVPGKVGTVTRPNIVKVKAFNEKMEAFEMTGEGFLARAMCHEFDHLKGELYLDKVEGELREAIYEEEEDIEE